MFTKKEDKDYLYSCPLCTNGTLHVHKKNSVLKCDNCSITGRVIDDELSSHKWKKLNVLIDGEKYLIEPKKKASMKDLTDDGQICIIDNNEIICVSKEEIEK